MNQCRPRPFIICQIEIMSTALFCRFRERGGWTRGGGGNIGVISREQSLWFVRDDRYNNGISPREIRFSRICDTRNRIHENYIDFKHHFYHRLCYAEIFVNWRDQAKNRRNERNSLYEIVNLQYIFAREGIQINSILFFPFYSYICTRIVFSI